MKIQITKFISKAIFLQMVVWAISATAFPIKSSAQSEFNFYVTPILPESQIEETTGYFDLNLRSGEEETLRLVLSNGSNEPIEVEISAHTAFTNTNGVVEYGVDATEPNPTLVYSIAELLETPDPVTIPPGETQEVAVTLKMPEESFVGILAGGIRFSEVLQADGVESESNLAIQNTFSYNIGIIVSNERTAVNPDLELLEVYPNQINFRNVFSATIQNYTPTYVNRLEIEAQVREVGKDEILYEAESSMMQMAPNSHFHYPIYLNGDRFRPGDYVLTMIARSGEHEWEWEEYFTVEREIARQLNEDDVTIDNSLNWWMIGTIGLGILLILVIGFLGYKQQQLKKQINQKQNEKTEE